LRIELWARLLLRLGLNLRLLLRTALPAAAATATIATPATAIIGGPLGARLLDARLGLLRGLSLRALEIRARLALLAAAIPTAILTVPVACKGSRWHDSRRRCQKRDDERSTHLSPSGTWTYDSPERCMSFAVLAMSRF
jgi:hypothetical protein